MPSIAEAAKIFEANREWALSVAGSVLRRLGSRADGQEIRQVAQITTWERAKSFDPRRWRVKPIGDPFQIYAYPSVHGACLRAGFSGVAGRARTQDGGFVTFAPIESAEETAAEHRGQTSIDLSIDAANRRRVIASLLADLPKRERHLIAEHYLGGASLSAVATSLHRSPATASTIHAQALNLLRQAAVRRGIKAGEWL